MTPYDITSGQLFKQVLIYAEKEKYGLSVAFIGSPKDALYAQFMGFIIPAYQVAGKKKVTENLRWWFSKKDKDFDKFREILPENIAYNKNFTEELTLALEAGMKPGCVIVDDYLIPAGLKINDILTSLNLCILKGMSTAKKSATC
ncbi:MAG: hypothetical protein JWQ57_1673 [Mucilaginibacter sp.]|nr:hypothetical protein [Mucilaginibacter sp.]